MLTRRTRSECKERGLMEGKSYFSPKGYELYRAPWHPEGRMSGYVLKHRIICESVLKKQLPKDVVIHHTDRNNSNNSNSNLIVCQDSAYHSLLHAREKALKECGNANWRKCAFCGQWDDPINDMYISKENHRRAWHRKCKNKDERDRRKARKLIKTTRLKDD